MSAKTVVKTSRKAAPKKAKVIKPAPLVTLSSIYATVASRKSIDTTKSAKLVRSKLRANFAKVCELDPNIAKVKTAHNDGNRWPSHVTREVAELVLGTPAK